VYCNVKEQKPCPPLWNKKKRDSNLDRFSPRGLKLVFQQLLLRYERVGFVGAEAGRVYVMLRRGFLRLQTTKRRTKDQLGEVKDMERNKPLLGGALTEVTRTILKKV